MKRILLLLLVTTLFTRAKAQAPVNDNCSGAINIPVGNPPPCGTGVQQSAIATVTGNITNATPGNPYIYQPGCSGAGGPNQAITANDVWYSFVATGYQAVITLNSTFANPNIAFYSGTCGSLGGGIGGCAVGAGGTVTLTINQMVPGTTYYLQVSGNVGQVGTFTLGIRNNVDCQDCLQTTTLTVNPPPVNGAYPPNTTVNFCLHIGAYKTINTNWLHGVQLSFGSGWNPASVVPNTPLPISAAGTWSYYPAGIGVQNAVNWGPGWYFDFAPQDGNPRNNFGDSNSGGTAGFVDTSTPAQWNFCFAITTNPSCSPGSNLSVTYNTSGDGESGSWSNTGCATDAGVQFNAVGSCCPPNMSSLPVSCFGTSTGSATATPIGAAGPYNYSWTGPAGYTATANNVAAANTISNVPAGIYTVTIVDNNLCAVSSTVQVTQPTSLTAVTAFTNAGCIANGTASVTASGGTPPYTYTWSPSGGNAAVASVPQGNYTVTVQDSRFCTRTATVAVGFTGTISAAFTTPAYTQCLNGNSFTFSAADLSGTHTYSFNPATGGPANGNTAIYGPVTFTAPGTYSVVHTITSGLCAANTTSVIVINPMPVATAGNNGPVCPGSNIVLNAGGGTTYAWSGPGGFTSAVQNPTITSANATNTGLYTVSVTALGCTSSTTTNVSLSTPSTSAANTGPYCSGSTIQLNTTAASSYTWSGPNGFSSNQQNPSIPNSSPAMAGTYSLLVSIGSCSATAQTNVTVNALPSPSISSNSPVCAGQTIILNGSGGVTYLWNGPLSFTSAASSPSIVNAVTGNTGVYTLTVTDANLCSNSTTHTIVVNPLPVPAPANNGPVCAGNTASLNASGGGSYVWNGPNGFTSLLQNPAITAVNATHAGVYTVTVTTLGCSATGSTNLIVNTPTTSAGNTGPYCAGSPIQLNTPLAVSYSWSGPNGFNAAVQNPVIPVSGMASGGTYSVIATIGTCTTLATTSVSILPLPTPSISSNGPVCTGRDLILNGSGGTTYQWSGPSFFNSAVQNPSITNVALANSGIYTLTVTDANLCANVTTLSIQINALPIASAIGATVCAGNNISMGASGGSVYNWSGPGGYTSALQNPVIVNSTAQQAGQYTVVVTDANTCTNTAVANVVVSPVPTPSITGNGTVCLNSVISFSASGGLTYQWSGPGNYTSAAPTITLQAASAALSGVYSVTVTSANSCKATAITQASVLPLPPLNISSDKRTGCVPLCINFSCTSTSSIQGFSWDLDNGIPFPLNTFNAQGCYTTAGVHTVVTSAIDSHGCTNSATYTIEAYPKPNADYYYNPTKPIANVSGEVNFTDLSNGANITAWNWYFMNNDLYTSSQQHPTFTYADAGEYLATLIVTSNHGCKDTTIKRIVVGDDFAIWIPNAFTPDGSGLNDVFQPKGFGILKYEMNIYDRWGEKIYTGNDFQQGWDGYYNNELCKNDVYVYRIVLTNVYNKNLEFVGHVTLVR